MSLYERIEKKCVSIPDRFSMSIGQVNDLIRNAPGKFSLICIVFEFGYMQGVRAERAGKAVL